MVHELYVGGWHATFLVLYRACADSNTVRTGFSRPSAFHSVS